jgi:phenylacetaldehyde dehydrogenase
MTVPFSASTGADSVRPLLIDGVWAPGESGAVFETVNPATGQPIASLSEASALDVDKAVTAARRAFEGSAWANLRPTEREKLLLRLADLIEENRDRIAELETLDQGKPLAVSAGDAARGAAMIRYFAGWITKLEGRTIATSGPFADRTLVYTRPEPVGVVAQIIPWNFPFAMACRMLGPALAAGCCVVLKPAEQTPLSALLLGELVSQAGIPSGVVNILTGRGSVTGDALVRHPGIDKIAFIGSTAVGKQIGGIAAADMKRVSLELGGKNPAIAFPDARPDEIAAWAAQAIFFNSGQVCTSASRLFLHDSIYDAVMERLVAAAEAMKVGPGHGQGVTMGPLVSASHLARVTSYIDDARDVGATIRSGGKRPDGLADDLSGGFYLQPTIIENAPASARLVREEVFGPVLVVERWSDVKAVLAAANDTPYGLAAGVFTHNLSTAHMAAKALKAGIVWVNTFNILDPAVPFGGMRQSGLGREFGEEGLLNYLDTKAIWLSLQPL